MLDKDLGPEGTEGTLGRETGNVLARAGKLVKMI